MSSSPARSRTSWAATSSARRCEFGKRAFVEGPLPVRLERGTLVVSGTADEDAIAFDERAGRIEVTLNGASFAFNARKVDRVRVDGGDGTDTFTVEDDRLELKAAGDRGSRLDRRRARQRRDRQGQGRAAQRRRPLGHRRLPGRRRRRAHHGLRLRGRRPDLARQLRAARPDVHPARQPVAGPLPDDRRPRRRRHHQRVGGHDRPHARRRQRRQRADRRPRQRPPDRRPGLRRRQRRQGLGRRAAGRRLRPLQLEGRRRLATSSTAARAATRSRCRARATPRRTRCSPTARACA